MNDGHTHKQTSPDGGDGTQDALVRRIRFSVIWVIPLISVLIAGFLVWRSFVDNGPSITVMFDTADGLTSGQTQVKNKSVVLGTVEGMSLTTDLRHVRVRIRMNKGTGGMLTDKARFWVVRPRINGASITGLETLMSGAYIAFDPGLGADGQPAGRPSDTFVGLEAPPGMRSDQPGRTFTLVASSIGSIGQGAPVFFRDVNVGEVLGYTMPPGGRGPVLIQIFVQQPYDQYLTASSRFWNVSGVKVGFGAGGLKVQLQSLQALFSGGVAFGLPPQDDKVEAAPADSVFTLYDTREDAQNAGYRQRLLLATYLTSSVKGLAPGAEVDMFGIQVGNVTSVRLDLTSTPGHPRVRVGMEVQLERIFPSGTMPRDKMLDLFRTLVGNGLRASTDSVSMLTGESMISLNFIKNPGSATTSMEGPTLVIPGQAGGMSGIMDNVSTLTARVAAMPFEQIGVSANNLLTHLDGTLTSPDVKQTLTSLRQSMQNLQALSHDLRNGVAPLSKRLPAMADQLEQTLTNANKLLASYGGNSDFHRSVEAMVLQLGQTARSLRFLSDFLTNHPSALIWGR
ncbi:PqiB family protein [Acetobacter vaccinii]|uniref:MCE family protein n=1 Tax=Acetobacter vaccinii TaxID=2592655 RepID=A0A5C1YLV3_9PROT|nr:MlaD family protein [Acetobacter vaccinii]QEO17294.1 MCE family protein [Acetobacter vaccinii]